jgi:Helix-turn-helix domain
MSVRVMADVWDFGPKDATECNVLVCLANHCDDHGGSCFPSIERIAFMARRSVRQVVRVIAALEAGGWIAVQHGRGRGVLSHYAINVDKLKTCHGVTFSAPEKGDISTPKKVTFATKKHDISVARLDRNVKEPKAKTRTNPPNPPARRGDNPRSDSDLFAGLPDESLAGQAERDRAIELALDSLMQSCGFTKRRLRAGLRAAIAQEADKGTPAATVGLEMAAAWKKQAANAHLLEVKFTNPLNFFGLPVWKDSNLWHWDRKEIERLQATRAGSF